MNPVMRQLAEQAGYQLENPTSFMTALAKQAQERNLNKFGRLIVQECINACGSDFGSKLIKQHFGVEE